MTIASGNVHEFPSEAHARYIPAVEEKNNQNISTLNGQAISEIQCPQRKMPPSEKSGPDCNNKPSLRKRRSTNIDQPSTICPGRHSKKPKKSFAESGTAGSHGGTVPADIIEEDPTQVNTANRQNEKTTDIRSSSLPGGASVNCNANHEADQADLNDGATAESDAHTDNAENSMPSGSSRDANEAGCTAGPGRASSANRLVAGFAGMAGSTAVRSIRGAVDLSNPFNVLTTVVQHAPVLVSAVADDDSPAATLAKYSAMAMTGVGIATSLCAAASATSAISAAAILGTCGARLVGQIASHIGVRYLLYPRLPDSVREYAAPWLHAGTEIGIAATSPIHTRTPDGTDHFAWPGGRATCGTDVRAVRAMGYGRVDVPSPEVTDLPPAGSAQVATPEAYNEREFMNGVKIFNRNGRVCITANTINDCLEPGDQLSIWSTAQKGSGDGASVDELATGLFSGTPLDALYTVLESLDQRFRFPVAGANPIPENRNTMVEETSVSDLPRRHRHESVTACPHNASRSLSIDPTPGNITSTQAYLNSTLSIPEVTENVIVNNETRPIELTRDLLMLHNPASHIAPFDQYNPSITVTEQEYEYSRLVLGLLQLRFSEVEDYQLPFGFVPVLSDGHGNTAGIGYRAIPYAHVSVQDINDLAKEDPNVKKYGLVQKHKTLAHQLGETCYQASMWDKLLYPDVIMDNPVDGPTSTNTINQVIADCYRFIPRHGYQLAEPALTYQEVLTGECLNRECAVVIDLLQKVGVTTLTLPVLADKHANTEYYLQWEPFHGEEPDDAEPSRASIPAPDHSSSESLKASPYNSSGETLDVKKWRTVLLSDISDQEMDELTAVTPYLQDGSPCRFIAGNPPFTGMIRNNPLLLSAINNIVDLISSYSYQGAVPDLYQTLEKYLIDKQGGTIESKQLLKGFLSEFRHISKQQRSVVPLLDRHDLTGYLEILRTQTGIADLALSDKIWVGNKCNEPHLLIFYELREVCSGALSLYKGAELILPQQLERFRTEFVDKNLADKVLSFAFEEREPSDLSTPPPEPPQVIEVTTQNSPADSISTPPQFNLSENDQSGFDDLPANFEQLTSTGNTQQIDNTNHRVANAQTIPGPTIKTEQSQVTDIIENQPLLLLAINNIVDLIASFSYKTRIPDLIETLEKYLRVKQGTTLDSEQKLKAFISDFRQISEQQRRDVSLPPGDELAGYLEILLPESDRSGLTLSDTIWVSDKCSEMHLLIPYQLKKVFSGALSLYHRSNLILPHKLRWLRGFFVHEHFPEIMHEAYLRLAGTRGTLSNYLKKFKEYSLAERKPFTLTTIHQDQLRGYLNILQQDIIKTQCKTTTEGRDQLSLSDKIWFRMEINEVFTLIPFRLKEVFFGALSGRNAAKLILPPQLEKYRELITHEDFKDIIQDAYLGHCNIDSIKTNKAPRKFLRRCMHFNESLQDNPFILPAINQIVNRITEYKPDLMATVAQRLAAKGGTNAYTRNELNSYLLQFQDAAMKEKARQLASSIESGRIRTKTPDELAGYLTLLQPNLSIQPNSNQLALSDPIWLRSKVDGINLLIPYTLEEALIGSISEFDLEECIVPPELEQNIVYLTHQNGTEILHEAYKVDVLESIRSPIESLLNIMIYPILYVEKTFRRLADQAGVTSMNLTTIIGTYKDDNYYPPGVVGIVLDILEEEGKLGNVNTYAAYDLLLNTGRGINIDNYFFPSNQYSNDQNALTLFNLMINTDIENDFKSLISSLSSSSDAETRIPEIMNKNLEFYPPSFTSDKEYQIVYDSISIDDPEFIQPYITASFNRRNKFGQPERFEKITLYSYLTGQEFTVNNVVEFTSDCSDDSSTLYRWLVLNGGSVSAQMIAGQTLRFSPFQMKQTVVAYEVIDVRIGPLVISEKGEISHRIRRGLIPIVGIGLDLIPVPNIGKLEAENFNPDPDVTDLKILQKVFQPLAPTPEKRLDYKNMDFSVTRDEFVRAAYARSKDAAIAQIDSLHRSQDEVIKGLLFDAAREAMGLIGIVPIVGDALDVLGTVILTEIEIAIETEYLEKKLLREESIMTYSVALGIALIPGMTMSGGKKIARKMSKKLNSSWLKRFTKHGDTLLDGVPNLKKSGMVDGAPNLKKSGMVDGAPNLKKSDFIDGQPNRQLDVDGNPKKTKIEQGSQAFDSYCGARKKRAPSSAGTCSILSTTDHLYKSGNMKFATKADGRLPTFYYSSKTYGSGRLRQQHAKGPKIQKPEHYLRHVFFKNKADKTDFYVQVKRYKDNGQLTNKSYDLLKKQYKHITNKPQKGYYHMEVAFESSAPMGDAKTIHASQGVVVDKKQFKEYQESAQNIYRAMKEAGAAKKSVADTGKSANSNPLSGASGGS